jgi:tetratricopeptide (TPR) repeat protein
VGAVWTRDGRPWRIAHDQTAVQVQHTDETNRKERYIPVDVAGYVMTGPEGKPISRFATLWAQKPGADDDARIVLASSATEMTQVQEGLKSAGLAPAALHTWRQPDDQTGYSGVWRKPTAGSTGASSFQTGVSEANLPAAIAGRAGSLFDLDLAPASPPLTTRGRATKTLQAAETALKAKPDDLNARITRASALLQLGENQKALDDLNAVIEKAPQVVAYQYRAIAHARLGHKDKAMADLEKFQKGDATESNKLYLAVVVAAELDEGLDKTIESLEAALKKKPDDSGLHYDAACAYALASQALARKEQAKSRSFSERALALLRKAIENGYADYPHMQEDRDLDPIRELPPFVEIMKAGHLDRRYAAVWAEDYRFDTIPLFGLDPTTHLQRCRELASQGYRMVAVSVARASLDGAPITASVWHRPVITEDVKDRLAERQARAAFALLRMGKVTEVVPLLTHSPDPRLRGFIINGLSPLGADPAALAPELDRLPATAQPTPRPGSTAHERRAVPSRDLAAAGAHPGTGNLREGCDVPRRPRVPDS